MDTVETSECFLKASPLEWLVGSAWVVWMCGGLCGCHCNFMRHSSRSNYLRRQHPSLVIALRVSTRKEKQAGRLQLFQLRDAVEELVLLGSQWCEVVMQVLGVADWYRQEH